MKHSPEEIIVLALCFAVVALGVLELAKLVVQGVCWALERFAKLITRWTINRWPDSGWKPLRKGKRWPR